MLNRRNQLELVVDVFVLNVPPTAKVIWRGPLLIVSYNRPVKPGIEPSTPGLQGERFIHYTTAAPELQLKKKNAQSISINPLADTRVIQ